MSTKITTFSARTGRAWRRALGILALSTVAAVATPALLPGQAQAQEEGSGVTDPARKAEIIASYLSMLERNPAGGFVLKQLLKEVGYGQQLEKLIDEYRQKAAADPKNLAFRLIEGHLLSAARRHPEAAEAYRLATEIDPRSPDAWLGYGLALQKSKRIDESGAAFEKALDLEKNKDRKMEILRDLADVAFERQDWDAADGYYQRMIKLDDSDFAREEYAGRLVDYKRYEQALAQYEAILKGAGRNVKTRATALKDIGRVHSAMGQYDKALEVWRQANALVSGDSYLRQEIEALIIEAYRDQNDLNGLISIYEERWGNPSYEQAMTLAGLYDETGKEDKAMEYYRKALAKNRSSVDARMKIIHLLERKGDGEGVIKAYEDLIKAEPGQPSYQFELAERYWRGGDKRKALGMADKISRSFASDPVVQSNLADLYLRWDERDKVLAQYQKLVRIAPNDPSNLIGLGEYYWAEGKKDKALETWRKILTTGGDKAEAHATLGQVYAEHGKMRESIEQYEKAIALAPTVDNYIRALALVHERNRDLTSAIAAWERLLAGTSRQHFKREARSRIIQIVHRQGQLRAAQPGYLQRFRAEPPDFEAGYFLGESYIVLKEFARAEAIFKELLDKRPEDQEALLALNSIYTETRQRKENIEVLRKLAQLNPSRAQDYFHRIAELSLDDYNDEQAVEFAAMAVDLNPNDATAHARLGKIYAQMQDPMRAAAEYRTAIALDAMAFDYYFELAEIYRALDKVREADELYRQLLGKARDEGLILRAGRKSIDINDALGELDRLESDLTPLIAAHPTRKVYSRLQLEVYDRMTRGLIAEADNGLPASRLKAEEALRAISRRALGPLLAALNEDDLSLQLMSIRILGGLRNPNAAVPLARLIDSEDMGVRAQAALAAGKLGDPKAIAPMLRATKDADVTVRQIAVWSLGRMNSKEAVAPLRKLMEQDPLWSIRALAAVGLGRLGAADALELLGQRLASPAERDAKAEVRVAAAWGLGALGDARGQRFLVQALREDRDPQVRKMSAWALGNIGSLEALEALLGAYWSSDMEVREAAGKALLRLGPDARGQRVPYVVWEENLGFFDTRNNTVRVEFFLEVLLSPDLLARSSDGSHAILKGEKVIAQMLQRQLERAEPAQLETILYDLDKSPEHISLGALTWTLPEDAARRDEVLAALGRIGAGLAERLRTLLTDDAPMVRAHTAGILGKIGDKGAVDKLIAALDDEHSDVRRKAALALGRLGDARAAAPLIARLSNADWMLRAQAAVALGMLGDKAALDPLVKALDDPYHWVQADVARALGTLGDKAAVKPLVAHLDPAPAAVKVEILRALASLGGDEARKALDRYRNDPDAAIRDASQ